MADALPAQPPDPAPKVDGTIGNAGIGIGWGLRQIATALTGDGGIRLLALCGVGSFTWVASYAICLYMQMETERNSLMTRVGEERVEREKSDRARADKESRDWMTSEQEKQRRFFAEQLAVVLKESATERERDRAMVFKLAGAGKINPDDIPANEIRPE